MSDTPFNQSLILAERCTIIKKFWEVTYLPSNQGISENTFRISEDIEICIEFSC